MQKFPIWFGGAQIFFSKASVLFQPRVLFFRRYQNFPVTCFAVQFIFFRPHQHFPATCSAAVFSDSTKIFHSRGVLQFFFSDGTKIFHSHGVVQFFFSDDTTIFHSRVLQFLLFRQHKCSNHVFCSSFYSDGTNFPATCTAIPFFSDSTKIFQPRVASFKLADISTTCDVVYFSFHQQQS